MKSKFKIILWWSFLIIYLEIIYKFFIMKDLLTTNTFSVVLFSIPWIIIFTIITSIFNEKVNKILTIVFSFLIVLITLAQIVYYNFYNSMFSFLSLTILTRVLPSFFTTGRTSDWMYAIISVELVTDRTKPSTLAFFA